MAIIHPLKPRMSALMVGIIIAVIWMTSIAVAFPNLLYAQTYQMWYNDGTTRILCYLEWPDGVYGEIDFW